MASLSHYPHYSTEVPLALLAQHLTTKTCSALQIFQKARQLHALITTTTLSSSSSPRFLYNLLLSLYSRSGSIRDAQKLFDRMLNRTTVSYNTMITAYSRSASHASFALNFFNEMAFFGLRPNASTYASVVHASCTIRDWLVGSAVHARVVCSGFLSSVCVQTSLLGLYSDCGRSEAVDLMFSEMTERDVVAWNSVITSHVKNGSVERGILLYIDMIRTGFVATLCTFTVVLSACSKSCDQYRGRVVHGQLIKSDLPSDITLQNALLDMYASCGYLETVLNVFNRINDPNLISWNSLIAGYSGNGEVQLALEAFKQLLAFRNQRGLNPDDYTFAVIVDATDSLPSLFYGKPLHAQVIKAGCERSIYVGNALISMYFENEELDCAENLFGFIPEKDFKIWTEMIVGYSRLSRGEEALRYFCQMQDEGHKVDSFSLSSALSSSADLPALHLGEALHSLALKLGFEIDVYVSASLVDMYAKNGQIDDACLVFHRIVKPDLKCWNSMIAAHGNHGNAEEAFKLFNEMVRQGLQPDHVTYVTLLSTCRHHGLVEKGRFYWFCMASDCMKPGLKHYTCMIGLLSKAGLLSEAKEMISRSAFADKSAELWRILLSSCVNLKSLDVGIYAAEQLLSFEPDDGSTYVMLSNLYASVGRWEDVAKMRQKIRGLMLDKEPGLSWIESKGGVHAFSADDESHHKADDCRGELLKLKGNLEGWEPNELLLTLSESELAN